MHRHMIRMEAWIASAILVLSFTASPASAQDGFMGLFGKKPAAKQRGQTAASAVSAADETADGEYAASASDLSIVDTRRLTLVAGQMKTVAFSEWIKEVEIGNDKVASANVNKKNFAQLLVNGIEPGVTEIIVVDKKGDGHRIEIMVTPDASPLQMTLSRLYPESNIEVIPAGPEGVAIIGYVDNPQAVAPIMDIAEKFYPGGTINALKVVGSQQVQLRVLIAEVSRTKLRALGLNYLHFDHNTYFTSAIGGLISVNAFTGLQPTGTFSGENNLFFGRVSGGDTFRGFMRALKQEGLVKIMAEPTLTTFSGRAAEMIVGGEFPIIVPGQQGTFSVEFRDYGNKLNFVPIVLGGGRIRLEVRPELSQLDYANGVQLSGFTIPGLQQRRIETAVELNTGESFVIGGLLSTTDSATTNKVPFIGDLPIIGAAFRTVEYNQEEKELVILVTPELVEPLKANQKPCHYPGSETTHPSNRELYLSGRFETPVCNACETARRAELGLDYSHEVGHPRQWRQPCVHAAAKANQETATPTTNAEAQPEKQQASEAQRPAGLPGLLGPLGYDAGK